MDKWQVIFLFNFLVNFVISIISYLLFKNTVNRHPLPRFARKALSTNNVIKDPYTGKLLNEKEIADNNRFLIRISEKADPELKWSIWISNKLIHLLPDLILDLLGSFFTVSSKLSWLGIGFGILVAILSIVLIISTYVAMTIICNDVL